MPLYMPVTGENIGNMNWAIAMVGVTVLFATCYWIFRARFRYMKGGSVMPEPVHTLEGEQ